MKDGITSYDSMAMLLDNLPDGYRADGTFVNGTLTFSLEPVVRGDSKAFLAAIKQMESLKFDRPHRGDIDGFEISVTDMETGDNVSGISHRLYAGTDLASAVKNIPKGYRLSGSKIDGKNTFFYIKEVNDYSSDVETGTMEDALSFAKTKLGYPYVWAGRGLETDQYDCSSFSQAVYYKAGVDIPRTANSQYSCSIGKRVNKTQLKRGDAIYFLTDKTRNLPVTHVGIYLGNNKMIHTNSNTKPLRIQKLKGSRYWNLIVGAKRFV